ncbi:MAG TPA: Xaa-Pro peptidase family protein [Pirellulales bacterium]|nr:Xaa-Pro peptidase family protein [Pirellulales bacterium]
MSRHETRRNQLRKLLRAAGADSLLVTNFTNVTYLTGFTGDDSYLLVGPKDTILVSDPRYTTQLEEECPDITISIRPPGKSMLDGVAEAVRAAKVSNLAIEADAMTVGLHAQLEAKLPKNKLVPAAGLVEELRVVKDKQEIEEIELAARYAEKGFAILRATLRPDRTEKEVAADLEYQMRLLGANGCSFPPIIAVGARAALPHARPTDQKIGAGDFVLVDWGATARHYKSDLTRVLVTGKISPKLERVYNVVLKAQLQAIAAIKPGLTGREVDAVARGIIADAGFARHFGHGLGHGLGLDIHEAPRLAAAAEQVLKPGMVVTVEPGIYLPGWGGVRIEDDILVTKTGGEVLTNVPKKLEESIVQ